MGISGLCFSQLRVTPFPNSFLFIDGRLSRLIFRVLLVFFPTRIQACPFLGLSLLNKCCWVSRDGVLEPYCFLVKMTALYQAIVFRTWFWDFIKLLSSCNKILSNELIARVSVCFWIYCTSGSSFSLFHTHGFYSVTALKPTIIRV